jgi:hypothetical protein
MAAQQPHDQDHDQDNPEYPADAITTTLAISAAAVIPEATPEQEDHRMMIRINSITGISASAVSRSDEGDRDHSHCRPYRGVEDTRPASLPAVCHFGLGWRLTKYRC